MIGRALARPAHDLVLQEVTEVNPAAVEFYTDEVDAETEEERMTTALEMMAGKTRPFLVGSTYQ